MIIRKERPRDYDAIYLVVKEAFRSAEHADGNEQDLVALLREGKSYIPELALVAEIHGEIVGHIMFTKAKVGESLVLALAPLSVLPGHQRKGIGTALVTQGHKIAKELGYGYSVVLGSEKYYPRMGYVPADTLGILPPFEVPKENFMAYKLQENAARIRGTMEYAKEFWLYQPVHSRKKSSGRPSRRTFPWYLPVKR